MKEKLVAIIIIFIMAFFTGFLFLYGKYVINGTKANNFVVLAFENNTNKINLPKNDLSAMNAFVSAKNSDPQEIEISYLIDGKEIRRDHFELSTQTVNPLPANAVLSAVEKLSSRQFEYEIKLYRDNKKTDQIKKIISFE